jgi:hypothetical protein
VQQPVSSAGGSSAAAAADLSPGRSVLASPGGSARLGTKSRSNLSSASGPGPSNIATAAKSIINRTPLRSSLADTAADDSIIVSNTPGLALLLGPGSGSTNTAAPGSAGLAPGQLGPPGSSSSSSSSNAPGSGTVYVQQQAAGMPAPLRVPGYPGAGAGAAGAAPPSPKSVSFGAGQQLEVYSQLPSSATSTSSAINRPLPYKPQDKTAGFLARKVSTAAAAAAAASCSDLRHMLIFLVMLTCMLCCAKLLIVHVWGQGSGLTLHTSELYSCIHFAAACAGWSAAATAAATGGRQVPTAEGLSRLHCLVRGAS